MRQEGRARIFMAWRRSNLIKVPARQHLECESALATEKGKGEWIRVSLRMRREQGVWGEVFRHASGWLNVFGCGSKQLFLLLGVSFIWMMKNLFEN